ncbi:uncharacterized protein LOC126778433 isoform X1 [Nymphalis io]|uniref:uncharacterized protein LOC126778433 isoform X1 n=1 Tax=Inachis io TaxID=171585 RepID=UPI00216792A2|nr:uncharacterized protein LOC126778433 isoform X1 [Nymphalis io]
MFKLLVVLSACVCVGYASVALGHLEPKPEEFKDQEGCYVKELNAVIPIGESRTSETSCVKMICLGSTIQYHSCSRVGLPVNDCKYVSDSNKPYPDCCTRLECP